MRLFALVGLCIAATTTIGCAGSRAYNLYPGGSPLDNSVYGVNPAAEVQPTDDQLADVQPTDDATYATEAPAVVATVSAPVPAASGAAVYTRRATLQSPPPPPPPAMSRAYRTGSYRPSPTPIRTVSTVRAPTRTLAAQPAPVLRREYVPQTTRVQARPARQAPTRGARSTSTYRAPARKVAPVRVRRPVARTYTSMPGMGSCSGGT